MSAESVLIARLDEAKATGNAYYRSKDYQAAAEAYSVGVKACPDLDEEEVPFETRQACAVLYTNRSAARYALKQYVASLSDAQCAQEFDQSYWKVKPCIQKIPVANAKSTVPRLFTLVMHQLDTLGNLDLQGVGLGCRHTGELVRRF
jgi:hypothetical protein